MLTQRRLQDLAARHVDVRPLVHALHGLVDHHAPLLGQARIGRHPAEAELVMDQVHEVAVALDAGGRGSGVVDDLTRSVQKGVKLLLGAGCEVVRHRSRGVNISQGSHPTG